MRTICLQRFDTNNKNSIYITICKRWIRIEEGFSFFYEEGGYWEDCGINVVDGAKIKRPISRVLQDLPEKQTLKKIAELKLFDEEYIKHLMTLKVA